MTRLVVLLPNWAPAVKSVGTTFYVAPDHETWPAACRSKAIVGFPALLGKYVGRPIVLFVFFLRIEKPCITCIADVLAVGSTVPELPSLSPVLQEVNRKRMPRPFFSWSPRTVRGRPASSYLPIDKNSHFLVFLVPGLQVTLAYWSDPCAGSSWRLPWAPYSCDIIGGYIERRIVDTTLPAVTLGAL
jgi:hypothetical protein